MNASVSAKSDELSTDPLDFDLHDPLGRWIDDRGWSGLQAALAAYVWALSSSFLISVLANTLSNRPGVRTLMNDWFYFISETITVFVVWMYYVWLQKSPRRVLKKLEVGGALRVQQDDLVAAQHILASRIPLITALLVSIAAGVLYFNQYYGYETTLWYNTRPVFVAVRSILVIVPTAYVTSFVILRNIVNTLVFRELLRDVNVNPMHPDRAGGLLPLGQYALRSTYVIALAGVVIALAEYRLYRTGILFSFHYFHILALLYLIGAPVSFFAPLSTARNAMLKAKNQLLLTISQQFNHDISKVYQELDGSADELKGTIDKVEQLQRIQALTISFPVWPFDAETLRRFSITVSSPFITIGLSILTEIIMRAL